MMLVLSFLISLVHGTKIVQTHSGHQLQLNIIKNHAPNVSDNVLRNATYEHVSYSNRLVSQNHIIEINHLAPQLTRVSLDKPIEIYVGKKRMSDLKIGPFIRRGNGYTFIFKEDQITLITAWGPNFFLSRIECSTNSRIFVNSAVGAISKDSRVDIIQHNFRTLNSVHSNKFTSTPFPQLSTDRNIVQNSDIRELQLYMVSDRSLTRKFCGSYGESNAAIAVMIENVKPLLMKIGISPRIHAIKGATLNEQGVDLFARPSTIRKCNATNGTICSETVLLLDSFRKVHLFKDRKRDATVVVTGYGLNSGAVGAAYIAAACNREWGWAWMQYTKSNEHVLAHELAHLLGALHDKIGIMRPSVGSNELEFSALSKKMITTFVKKVSSSWCLRKTSREDDIGKRLFRMPLHFYKTQPYVCDVTFTSPAKSGKASLTMLFTHGLYGSSSLYISTLSSISRTDNNEYSVGKWTSPLQVPDSTTVVSGGGGIAFGNIKSSISQDFVVAYIDTPTSMKYRVCFNVGVNASSSCQKWSVSYNIPIKTSSRIKTVGITIADTRKIGKNDLIIVYVVDHKSAFYRIGWDFASSGNLKSGWSKPRKINYSFTYTVCGLSVATCDTEQNGQLDLIVYSTEVTNSERLEFVRIGRNINKLGEVLGDWTQPIPAPKPLSNNVTKGGISIMVLPGDTYPTTAIVHSEHSDNWEPWTSDIDFSFNVTEAARAEANGSLFENIVQSRSYGCLDCYQGRMMENCVDRLKSCDDGEATGSTKSTSRFLYNWAFVRESHVNKSKLFCVGFDALFIHADGDSCEVASSRENVIAKGVVLSLAELLLNKTHPDETIEVEKYVVDPNPKTSDEIVINYPGEWANKGRPPNRVVIWLKPKRQCRRRIIVAALVQLKRSTDFAASFKDVQRVDLRRIHRNKFIVRLHFKNDFGQEPIKNRPFSPYGV